MLQVYVCVGSSCHLKGSYYIIKTMQSLVKRNKLEDRVEIKASFCLEHCTQGVCIRVGDEYIGDITPSNVQCKFEEHIVRRVRL